MQPLLPEDPQVVGAYRLLGRLGAGGMGRVYLGRSTGGRTVAVKIVHPHFAADDQFRERFRREVRAARSVGGAWTAPVLDADPEAAVPWVATGYVAGPSLSEAVASAGPLPAAAVRALGAGLAEALTAVHAQGLVHRDVKPSNVLLALDGPRIVDFGIARATEATASLTSTGVSVGSPGYMAPEQILGRDVTGAADVFSLGAVLAYAAMGAPPFPGDGSAALLYKVVHEPPVLGPALTGGLRSLVADCLTKEAAARPSPQDVVRRLAPGEGGARALLGSGWLPGPVVEEVSRRAVELLDLEAEPVAAAGAFGPPDPSYGREIPEPEAVPEPRPVRSRRASCVLVLSVAGALAAATTAAFVFHLLPGGGGSGASAGRPATSAPPDRSSVPEAFLGTWSGDVVQSDGTANGTMTSTITAGGKGAYVVRTRYGALGVVECDSKARLLSASASKITLEEVTDGELRFGCTGVTATVTYTLAPGGKLAFASGDPTGGRPTATLSRSRG